MALFAVLFTVFVLVFNSEIEARKFDYSRPSPYRRETYDAKKEIIELSQDVIPLNYALSLNLDNDVFTKNTFKGIVTIGLNVTNAVKKFPLHAEKLAIDFTNMKLEDKSSKKITISGSNTAGGIVITSDSDITEGIYKLTIPYTGELSETDMAGFYKSTYVDENNATKFLASTQFESTDARRAFPCFDEPSLKATFTITLTFPSQYNALSNTGVYAPEDNSTDTKTVKFKQTPKMSTYLVAFIVSEFVPQTGETIGDGPTELYSRKGKSPLADVALKTAPLVLDVMATYTGFNYIESNIGKLTQVAIPDFAAGAMENWGLVTYREADILWDENHSSRRYYQTVVTVVTHELSHQWFGDLVTLDGWNDVFLNEGFATYFEYHAADQLPDAKDWELTKQFVIEQVQGALLVDSQDDVYPLSTKKDVPGVFNAISYNKGGSIYRMVHHFLGLDNFKAGLTSYIKQRAYNYSTPEILWDSFEEVIKDKNPVNLPSKVNEIMHNWTYEQGYPLLTVSTNGTNITISQEQFLLNGTGNTKWYVPITCTVSKEANFSNTTPSQWLKPGENLTLPNVLENSNWIILNIQQTGYYRVDYDDDLWKNISNALSEDIAVIDEISRSQIVDDLFNLARANKRNLDQVLDLIKFLNKDDSYYTWYSAFNGFSHLLQHINDATVLKVFQDYIKSAAATLFSDNPFKINKDTNNITAYKKVLAGQWACRLNLDFCVNNSSALFKNLSINQTEVNPDLRSVVYCTALQHSSDIGTDFQLLKNRYVNTDLATERVTILKALGCANDQKVRQSYLETALTDLVRIQDASYVFSSVYSNNGAAGVDDVLQFVTTKHTNINDHFADNGNTVKSLINTVASLITQQSQIDKLNDFINKGQLDDDLKAAVQTSVNSAKRNLEEVNRLETTLKSYFKTDKSSAVTNSFYPVYLMLIVIGYFVLN